MRVLSIMLAVLLSTGTILAQAGTPFITTPAAVPPAVGSPGCSLAWDTTNKLLVVTFVIANSAGAVSTLSTISYNPRTLEGQNLGGALLSFGATGVLLKHNLPTDPLLYQIGTASATGTIAAIVAQCTTVTPIPTGQTACPALPF